MKTFSEIGRKLDEMADSGSSAAETAAFLAAEARENPVLLRGVGSFCSRWEKLLAVENLRRWPVKYADVLTGFFSSLPYLPPRSAPPCGKMELLLAGALRDRSIPKAIRIRLWRCLVMDGYVFPRYVPDAAWDVPAPLYDHPAVRDWLCQTRHEGWEDLRCSDPHFFGRDALKLFKTDADRQALEAIDRDSPSGLLMPLAIAGRRLPASYMQAVLQKKAVKIVMTLLGDAPNLSFFRWITPKQLFFYVCANWNNDETIPLVELLEKKKPGLVKNSADAFGHDALWYTLYQRDRFNRATEAARRITDPLDQKLIELGCDPDRENDLGLSCNDLAVARQRSGPGEK